MSFRCLWWGRFMYPRTYSSEARLFIRLGKESVTLDPTATTNDVVNVNESRESEINSELEILRARVLLEDTVERLSADDVLSPHEATGLFSVVVTPLGWCRRLVSGDISGAERAVNKLEKSIVVSSPRKSNVIIVKCKAADPRYAQQVLSAFLDCYLMRHVQANRTAGSYEFFVDQAELLRDQLSKAQDELRDEKNRNGFASVEGHRANLEQQANLVDVAFLESQRAMASSEEKILALRRLLQDLPQHELAEESVMPSAAADIMRNELYKVQILEQEAKARFTDEHPHIVALRRQVEETRKILAAEEASRKQPTHKLSEIHQAVEKDLMEVQANLAAQKAEAAALGRQSDAVQAKLRALNDTEVQIAGLTREAGLIEDSYRTYVTNREQARIDGALESGRISNVNIVQPASFVAKPSSPSMMLAFVMAAALATFAAVAVAFLSEHGDRSLKSADETEQALGLPVLFSVPRRSRQSLVEQSNGH